jgi:hypothetical protein
MNFKEATDTLFNGISHAELAKELGVSVASIRQARLRSDADAHRSPPPGWEKAVIQLAAVRIQAYQKLIKSLRSDITGIE